MIVSVQDKVKPFYLRSGRFSASCPGKLTCKETV